MKFCDISSFYSNKGGGVRTYHLRKSDYFNNQEQHDYVMVVPSDSFGVEKWGRTKIYRIKGVPVTADGSYRQIVDLKALRNILVLERPDVLEIGSCYLDNWLGLLSCLNQRPLLSGFYHADFPDSYIAPAVRGFPKPIAKSFVGFWHRYVRFAYSRLDVTCVASKYIREKLISYGLSNTTLTSLGVDTRLFTPKRGSLALRASLGADDGSRIVLHAGRFSPEKGIDTLEESIPLLLNDPRNHLVFVGDGPLKSKLESTFSAHPRTHFLGYISDRERLADLMASCDVFISPGPYETFGLSTLEALSSGAVVVCPATGGSAELVSSSGAGLTFEANNPRALADRVSRLLASSSLHLLGKKGRRFVEENHSWESAFDKMLSMYLRKIDLRKESSNLCRTA